MTAALLARFDMGLSLGFHILFASVGMTMPVLMVLAEALWIKTRDPHYLELARAWSKGTAVFFAIGAVSGTVLAFELGLLFPSFMETTGAIIGLPFALEGFAFFTEAIFLGVYLYGWDKLSPRLHLFSGIIVAFSGLLSAAFVTCANAWMNTPVGFRVQAGKLVDINPLQALLSPAVWHEVPHAVIACYLATGFIVAAIHASALLRLPAQPFHTKALKLSLGLCLPLALLQPVIGHFAGQAVALRQPMKFAAMENQQQTQRAAPFQLPGGVRIPGLLSYLATGDVQGEVRGLQEFPAEDRPHPLVHTCFQIMIIAGTLLAGLAVWGIFLLLIRRRWETCRPFLKAVLACGSLGAIATETGWIVTEVGRQPWIVYEVLRTSEGVTTRSNVGVSLALFLFAYLVLGALTLVILRQYIRRTPGFAGSGT